MDPATLLSRLDRSVREKLDPFPLISPTTGTAESVKYKNEVTGEYLIAKPYDRIYGKGSTILNDISKSFTQRIGARGTLLIGPKASGKTHLLGIELDYAKTKYNAKVILINEKEYDFIKLADLRVSRDEAIKYGIVRSICRKLEIRPEDVDGLINGLKSMNWNVVQIIIDDLYETDWRREEVINDIFTLFKIHTRSKEPIIRTSVALHTGSGVRAKDFFDLYRDELTLLTTSYDDPELHVRRIVDAMMRGEIIPGATVIPIVTEWQLYVDEVEIEKAFKDFFSKYVSTIRDDQYIELRKLTLDDLADESFIIQSVIRAMRYGVYRVFAEASTFLWYTFKGEKIQASKEYVDIVSKYRELRNELSKYASEGKKHKFYKSLIERVIVRIMKLRSAELRKSRKWRVISGNVVRWRTIEYYVVNSDTLIFIIPQLATRKYGVVVERPKEVTDKIADLTNIMSEAYVIGVATEDMDDRGLRDALGIKNYALLKLPSLTESKLKYFYAQLLSIATTSSELGPLLERYVRILPSGYANRILKVLKGTSH